MPTAPLTHHDILRLVEPFARQGHHVDLAASDRAARTLRFKPVDGVPAAGDLAASLAPLRATLQLDCREGGSFRLTRTLTQADGLQATLQAEGPHPGALLALVEAVAPGLQFQRGPGYVIARSYDLGWIATTADAGRPPSPTLTLRRGEAWIDGLKLVLKLMEVRGTAGDIALEPAPGEALDLPEDLLAVLGWNWAPLQRNATGWNSKLRLRGQGAQRSRRAEAALGVAAQHLAQVMAAPPAQFHQRHRWARWGVVLRRSIPSLTAIGLIATALLLPRLTNGEHSGLMMALHYVPIAVLALSFSLQEMARFEIPPWPRRAKAASWRRPAGPGR